MYIQEIDDEKTLLKFSNWAMESGVRKRIDEATELTVLWIKTRNKELDRGGYLNNAIILADIALKDRVKELTKNL